MLGTSNHAKFYGVWTSMPAERSFCSYQFRFFVVDLLLSCTICPRTTRSLVFLAYDCLSERRQRKVLEAAVQSSRIVSNLFPSVVRDRLFRTEGSKKMTERSAAGIASQKLRLKTFLHHEGKVVDNNDEGEGKEAAPIAELFPDCTVCK